MGWFQSEYKTSVSTSVSRVVADNLLPKTAASALLMSILENGSMLDYTLGALVTGLGVKTDRMYQYALANYPVGLPSKTTAFSAGSEPQILAALNGILGSGVSIEYSHFGPLNHLHYAWNQVIKLYGFNESTNEITTLTTSKGTPVYLKDLVVVVKDSTMDEITNGSLDFWGTTPTSGFTMERYGMINNVRPFTPLVVDPTIAQDYVKLIYTWSVVDPITKVSTVTTDTLNILIPVVTKPKEYFQIRYRKGGQQGYFLYEMGTGYPTLDSVYANAYKWDGTFFPNVYFRKGGKSMAVDKTTDTYTSSVALLKIIGIDYDEVSDAVDKNPDAQYIEQAMLTLAVPANTKDPIEQQYLFDFFDVAYLKAGGTRLTRVDAYDGTAPISMIIQDSIFKSVLGFDGIYKEVKAGVLGKVGTYTSSLMTTTTLRTITRITGGHYTGSDNYSSSPVSSSIERSVHVYRKQTTDSYYEEIQVVGLHMSYDIKNGYATVGTKADNILMVPLDHSLVEKYSLLDRELLYSRSLHFIFNAYAETEVKWYQQEWFASVLMIVAIVITICDWGSDGGSVIGSAAALFGAGSTVVFLLDVIWFFIIKPMVISAIFRIFVNAVGIKFAFLVALCSAVYSLGKITLADSIKGAPWAAELMMLSSGLVTGINAQLKYLYGNLNDEYNTFEEFKKEKLEELDTANNLLEQSTLLNPLELMGRTPSQYYAQTVHAGNVGVNSMEATLSFVTTSLTLPTFAETIES